MSDEESPTRWKNNGLPRKGWYVEGVHELDKYGDEACDWCGTLIKYVFTLSHPALEDVETYAGCVCAEHLSEDYVRPKDILTDFERRKRNVSKRPPAWKVSHNGNDYFVTRDIVVTVFCKYQGDKPSWCWVKDGEFSPKFPTREQAMRSAEINAR